MRSLSDTSTVIRPCKNACRVHIRAGLTVNDLQHVWSLQSESQALPHGFTGTKQNNYSMRSLMHNNTLHALRSDVDPHHSRNSQAFNFENHLPSMGGMRNVRVFVICHVVFPDGHTSESVFGVGFGSRCPLVGHGDGGLFLRQEIVMFSRQINPVHVLQIISKFTSSRWPVYCVCKRKQIQLK